MWWLTAITLSLAGPPRPEGLAQLHASGPDGDDSWSLYLYKRMPHRSIGPGPHVEPVSTSWKPDFDRGDGEVFWLVGHRLSTLHNPGDVRVTVQVLIEVPDSGAGAVKAVWHEDRMAVPTETWSGTGLLDRAAGGGGGSLKLLLSSPDDGERSVQGVLWMATNVTR